MTAYCDTSVLIRRLLPGPLRDRAVKASGEIEAEMGFIPITTLVRFEVIQALRFEVWLHSNDRRKGFPSALIEPALNLFLAEVGSTFRYSAFDMNRTLSEAERITRSTSGNGWRTLDILHVAAALTMNTTDFFSFDNRQNELAAQHGLKTPLREATP